MDTQQLMLWAAIAFAAWYLFFRPTQETYDAPYASFPQKQEYSGHGNYTQDQNSIANVTAPPPSEIPQYAAAHIM